jgi:hypothetical protein
MNSNIIVAGLILLAGAILILSFVLFLQLRQRQKVRAQVEQERRERENEKKRRQLAARQNGVGNTLFAELSQAAHQNKISSLPLETDRWKQHTGSGYSINVYIPDASDGSDGATKGGYAILQININMEREGKEIHVLKLPGGPERDYPAAEFDLVRNELYEWVECYPRLT